MPTIEQIRAARALLDWSQSDLADKADLSQTGIARIENGTNKPNTSTLEKIRAAFGNSSIEFIDGGVRLVHDKLTILQGNDSLRRLQDDIYHTLSTYPGDIRLLGVEEIAPEETEDFAYTKMHIQRLIDIGSQEKILIEDGKKQFIAPMEWYRWIPKQYFSPYTVFIYHSKIAIHLRPVHNRVLLLDNSFFADSLKSFFDFIWDNAKPAKS